MFDKRIDSVCVQQWLSFIQYSFLPGQIKADENWGKWLQAWETSSDISHFTKAIEILSVMPFSTVIHKQIEVENGT